LILLGSGCWLSGWGWTASRRGLGDPHPGGGTPKRRHAHPRLYILFPINDPVALIDPLPLPFSSPKPPTPLSTGTHPLLFLGTI
jgi:hypothetical protein